MGLPLFVPPVESDIPSKPAAKRAADPSHARSPIGRIERNHQRRRQLNESREHQLRIMAAAQASEYNPPNQARSALQPHLSTRYLSRLGDVRRVSGRQSPRLENPRISELAQRLELERRYYDQETANELARDLAAEEPDDLFTYTPPQNQIESQIRSRPPIYTTSNLSGRSIWARMEARENEHLRYRRRRHTHRPNQPVPTGSIAAHRHAQRVRYADGLGDRDRSLSPEGDGVWDTLQSTLTPDPQPPSVGSSFASTVISASQQTQHVDNSEVAFIAIQNGETDPPCDPIVDNSGSDGDDYIEDMEQHPINRVASRSRRSYAEVVAEPRSRRSPGSTDASDPEIELFPGMRLTRRQIIERLASHTDIPDHWWAQAGLWEDSN
ncbi:hypothetical protein SAMD00023353_1101200 [Rosellinia necatrix]|uniref:Uncharacterized protein n=1 Tax=Rosellinia necatrix TaxID=77044 RepID=A0A1S7UMK6_ROSNE|nr:hypothetical protein SAMD00023353_1101200 [Rosellinia necatrix]